MKAFVLVVMTAYIAVLVALFTRYSRVWALRRLVVVALSLLIVALAVVYLVAAPSYRRALDERYEDGERNAPRR